MAKFRKIALIILCYRTINPPAVLKVCTYSVNVMSVYR